MEKENQKYSHVTNDISRSLDADGQLSPDFCQQTITLTIMRRIFQIKETKIMNEL
jgi:hypothetical protein